MNSMRQQLDDLLIERVANARLTSEITLLNDELQELRPKLAALLAYIKGHITRAELVRIMPEVDK